MKILFYQNEPKINFYVEPQAFKGVKRVADKVVGDYCKVTGAGLEKKELQSDEKISDDVAVVFATVDNSQYLAKLEEKKLIDLSEIRGKWEVYGQFVIEGNFFERKKKTLVIAGSDKRGTIYGMFDLSEKMGVSPLCYWADSVTIPSEELYVEFPEKFVSKEPSVKYRGFFINDEWPCFGNWTNEHFGGFNAKMYDNVFELLLRLKGNYLWPAMWSSSFAWDGPGLQSYELADEYGVVIGNSHHEPCLRAGEEYRQVRGKDSIYGDAWSFTKNPEGIERFWKDSLDERAHLESIVTIGMRGEADSTILGADATLEDNINLLRDVILCQKRLLKQQEDRLGKKLPTMWALYKEVEPFFYGDETTKGLCGWSEIDDVILMLCEDNHGYMRTLPTPEMRNHPGGYGMYYHVDYHGDPISYEWINSTPITLMRSEMSRAYESGVQKLWILNVGDLKHNEFPLSFFLNMAYDYEKWGKEDRCEEYTKDFTRLFFGNKVEKTLTDKVADVLTQTVDILHVRRPEHLNPYVFHPCHYNEADRQLEKVSRLSALAEEVFEELPDFARDAYYSLTYFQTKAGMNLERMMVCAGRNALYAKQGRPVANLAAEVVKEAIQKDRDLAKEFAEFKEGKWKGMEMEAHIGFTSWNEDGCRYPVVMNVEPVQYPRMFVMRADEEPVYTRCYGPCMKIMADDFLYDGRNEVTVIISNTGIGSFDFTIKAPETPWLMTNLKGGTVVDEINLNIYVEKSKVPEGGAEAVVAIDGCNTHVEVIVKAMPESKKKGVTLQKFGYLCTKENADCDSTWTLNIEEDAQYMIETWLPPMNPPARDGILRYGIKFDDGEPLFANTVPKGYTVGKSKEWCEGVLNHRHVCYKTVLLKKGVHTLSILDEGTGLKPLRVMLYNEKNRPLPSYMGPQ